ncbi:MAG: hypothetical protein JW818_23145 [Pirellulales bacterium]|nr:hypothetical protein [Pirellulales bacterium]
MRRHIIGIFGLILLAMAGGLMAWGDTPAWEAACLRVGSVLTVLWLAYDDLARCPRWLLGAAPLLLVLLALRPHWFWFVLPVLIVLAILRPRRPRGSA